MIYKSSRVDSGCESNRMNPKEGIQRVNPKEWESPEKGEYPSDEHSDEHLIQQERRVEHSFLRDDRTHVFHGGCVKGRVVDLHVFRG
jgi:hypothetical protein